MKTKIRKIPDEDQVMRYVPWTKLIKDDAENIIGVFPQAYERKVDLQTFQVEESLSVNWLEFHGSDHHENIEKSVHAMRKSFSVGRKSAFAVGNVGAIKNACHARSAKIRVVHEPEDENPGHAGIRQLPREDLDLLDALAADVFKIIILNRHIPVDKDAS